MKNRLIGGLAAIVLGAIVAPFMLPLGLLICVGGFGCIAFGAIRQSGAGGPRQVQEDLPPEFRAYLAPLRKLHDEIAKLVEEHSGSTTIRVVGAEAMTESAGVVEQATKLVAAAAEVKRALRGKSEAESDIKDLENRIAASESADEKDTLGRALEARKQEVERYAVLDRQWASLHANLRQAEAALAEVKARLILVASKPDAAEDEDEGLRERLSRLRALSDSFGESDEMLEEKNR